jgi:glucan 1,3-beta-glucosidase
MAGALTAAAGGGLLKRSEASGGVTAPGVAASAIAETIPSAVVGAVAPASLTGPGKIRGVNLGAWLVLEKWMVPDVYAGTDAGDEYSLCDKLGQKAATARLRAHQDTYITDADFQWLAAHGVNAVRLPVGYWILGGEPPFIGSPGTLDRAFRQAAAHGISVLVDLHGAPGSQNGWDHSGRAGTQGWAGSPTNISHTLDVVERLAGHCAQYDNLLGFELLNEPRWDVPIDTLKSYYQDGYRRVRKSVPAERASVVIHDGFRPMEWSAFMQAPEYENVVLDTHIYQCYTDDDKRRDINGQIALAADRRKSLVSMEKQLPVIVGEWSAALPGEAYAGATSFEQEAGRRGYAAAQLTSYDRTRGWFFWSYKNPNAEWSFRETVGRGWMPPSFADVA